MANAPLFNRLDSCESRSDVTLLFPWKRIRFPKDIWYVILSHFVPQHRLREESLLVIGEILR